MKRTIHNQMQIFAETERLILREVLDTDLEAMFELDSDPLVHKYLGNKPIKTKDDAQKNIDYIRRQYIERGIGRWAVINKKTQEFMGWSGLKLNTEDTFNGYSDFIDVGYRLIPKFWGKGYATESGKAAIAYAFETMSLPEVFGITEMGNQASHKVLLKIGLGYIEDFYFEKEDLPLRWYEIKNTKP